MTLDQSRVNFGPTLSVLWVKLSEIIINADVYLKLSRHVIIVYMYIIVPHVVYLL